MDTKYWIIDDKLIFKPKFDEELEEYYNVIGKYNTLIFSNYDNPEITIKTDNKYEHRNCKNYKESKFNKEIKLTENITNLSFGMYFNKKTRLTKNLTLKNNKKIINYLTNQVENLKFLNYENKIKINNLPNSIRRIEIKGEKIKIRKAIKAKIEFI